VEKHIVECLVEAGFSKAQVRKHRVFERAAIIARTADSPVTLMISPPLEEEEEFYINVYRAAPTEMRYDLPIHKEVTRPFHVRHFVEVTEIVRGFLKV
jgi:hypothetical protein